MRWITPTWQKELMDKMTDQGKHPGFLVGKCYQLHCTYPILAKSVVGSMYVSPLILVFNGSKTSVYDTEDPRHLRNIA